MFAYVTDHPINTIIPYPGRVFPIAMGFFHRLSVDELVAVQGIGEQTVKVNREHMTVGAPTPSE
jgi:hypothetical protein